MLPDFPIEHIKGSVSTGHLCCASLFPDRTLAEPRRPGNNTMSDDVHASRGCACWAWPPRPCQSNSRRLASRTMAGLLFRGFLAFLDPPKDSAIPCIKELYARGRRH